MVETTNLLGTRVTVTMDRPLGSAHPRYPDLVYPLNYGFVAGILAGDVEAIDAYVLGPTMPCRVASGTVIAIIHRLDDVEDKLIVVADGYWGDDAFPKQYTVDSIRAAVNFQERYFRSTVLLWKEISNAALPACSD